MHLSYQKQRSGKNPKLARIADQFRKREEKKSATKMPDIRRTTLYQLSPRCLLSIYIIKPQEHRSFVNITFSN